VENIFPNKDGDVFLPWTTHTYDGTSHSVLIAELSLLNKNFAYLFEIIPINETNNTELRQYKMFLISEKSNFAKLTNSEIFDVITRCAKNKGKWLNTKDNKDNNKLDETEESNYLRKKTLKHGSKTVKRWCGRILDELKEFGLIKFKF
jgi:hypothetical protein